jgi:hypothetical protein
MTDPTEKVQIEIKVEAQADEPSCSELAPKIVSAPAYSKPMSTPTFLPVGQWCKWSKNLIGVALVFDILAWIPSLSDKTFGIALAFLFSTIYGFVAAAMVVKTLGVAHDNLESGGVKGLKFNGPGVIYAWFLPVLNLYYPYLMMLEIWRGSNLRTYDVEGTADASTRLPVLRWWIATLVGYVFCWLPGAYYFALTPHFSLRDFTLWPTATSAPWMVYWCLIICCRVFSVFQLRYLLGEIAHRQLHKFGKESGG